MIYPETGWFEIEQYNDKQAATIVNLADKTWLYRYPLPTIIDGNYPFYVTTESG